MAGVAPLEKSAHYGHWQYYNDGIKTQSEDSWDGQNKDWDWWGYTWPRTYVLGRVVYTTGNMFSDGGWFSAFDGGLRVQVRRGATWAEVTGPGRARARARRNHPARVTTARPAAASLAPVRPDRRARRGDRRGEGR